MTIGKIYGHGKVYGASIFGTSGGSTVGKVLVRPFLSRSSPGALAQDNFATLRYTKAGSSFSIFNFGEIPDNADLSKNVTLVIKVVNKSDSIVSDTQYIFLVEGWYVKDGETIPALGSPTDSDESGYNASSTQAMQEIRIPLDETLMEVGDFVSIKITRKSDSRPDECYIIDSFIEFNGD